MKKLLPTIVFSLESQDGRYGLKTRFVFVFLVALLSAAGCRKPAATSKAKLDFLAGVPEFHDLELKMTESDLNKIIAQNKLGVQSTAEGNRKSYWIWNEDGENVIVGFEGGDCTGIQRMRQDTTLIGRKE